MATISFTKSISATDFRHRLKEALDELDRSGTSLVVTRRGEPRFVVLTLEGYEDLIDTRLAASPLLQQRLSEARAHYEAGEGGSYEALRQELLEEGCPGGLAKGSVVNEGDFAEVKAWVFRKSEPTGEEV